MSGLWKADQWLVIGLISLFKTIIFYITQTSLLDDGSELIFKLFSPFHSRRTGVKFLALNKRDSPTSKPENTGEFRDFVSREDISEGLNA